jgi:hypothetical protein
MKRIPKIKVKKKKKKRKIVGRKIDPTGGRMIGKYQTDLPDDVFGDAIKFFKG